MRSKAAGERVLKSVTAFLAKRLRLPVNVAKSAVARPWERQFLGDTMTWHKQPPLKVAPTSVTWLKEKIRTRLREGRGRKRTMVIQNLHALLRGLLNTSGRRQ